MEVTKFREVKEFGEENRYKLGRSGHKTIP